MSERFWLLLRWWIVFCCVAATLTWAVVDRDTLLNVEARAEEFLWEEPESYWSLEDAKSDVRFMDRWLVGVEEWFGLSVGLGMLFGGVPVLVLAAWLWERRSVRAFVRASGGQE
ncbi:MAG: hypothetical protein AAF196_06500 [Planctomycetota bacterium]